MFPIVSHPLVKLWFDNSIYRITQWVYETEDVEEKIAGKTVYKTKLKNNVNDLNFRNSEPKQNKKQEKKKPIIGIPDNIKLRK